eukprot:scaffold124964_cov57-Phaeocystis_antarctica.AAC.1
MPVVPRGACAGRARLQWRRAAPRARQDARLAALRPAPMEACAPTAAHEAWRYRLAWCAALLG